MTSCGLAVVFSLVFCLHWSSFVVVSGSCPDRASKRHRTQADEFAVLIDAGSTGTRVWVYSWSKQNTVATPRNLPPIECVFSSKVSKGLAEYAIDDDLDGLKEVVQSLIRRAEEQIPTDLHPKTPIFLMATAGMRLLLEDKAIQVVEELDALFRNASVHKFTYDSPHNTRILSGEEEGVFAWLAVNYLAGKLKNIDAVDLYRTTSGILELGGASTQIAFIPRGSVLSDKFPISVAGEKYPIYVHSYLHYGQDYVDFSIQRHLTKDRPADIDSFNNPCMLVGEERIWEGKRFNGTGDPSACVSLIEKFIYKAEPRRCHPKPCAIGSVYQPKVPSNQTFYAIGAFYFILKDLKVLSSQGTFTPAQAYEAAFRFCSKNFEELKREQKAKSDKSIWNPESEKFISKPCSIGLYMSILFTRGYGFQNDSQQIIAAERINNHPIDWTLGALIYENANRLSNECPPISRHPSGKIWPDNTNNSAPNQRHTSAYTLLLLPAMVYSCLSVFHS